MQEEIEDISNHISDPRIAVLALGGFVYWDAHWAQCGVSALKLGKGLCFDAPKPLSRLADAHDADKQFFRAAARLIPIIV